MHKAFHLAMIFTIGLWTGGIFAPTRTPAADPHPVVVAQAPEAEHPTDAEHHDVAAEHQQPGITDFNPGLYAWQLVLFFVLFGVLAIFVWPPILRGLRGREEKIRGDLTSAETAAREAQATLNEYKQQLAAARKEAQQLIEQGKLDAQRASAQLKEQSQQELQQMRQRAETDINAAKEDAVASIYEQAADLSTKIAGQILRREIDSASHQALVDESLSKLSV